jgi:hypothetical protein
MLPELRDVTKFTARVARIVALDACMRHRASLDTMVLAIVERSANTILAPFLGLIRAHGCAVRRLDKTDAPVETVALLRARINRPFVRPDRVSAEQRRHGRWSTCWRRRHRWGVGRRRRGFRSQREKSWRGCRSGGDRARRKKSWSGCRSGGAYTRQRLTRRVGKSDNRERAKHLPPVQRQRARSMDVKLLGENHVGNRLGARHSANHGGILARHDDHCCVHLNL